MSDLAPSITVSFLAMGVIFLTLSSLIGVIKILVNWMPYTEPLQKARLQASIGDAEIGEHIAVIHNVIAHHLDKRPEEIQIVNVHPL